MKKKLLLFMILIFGFAQAQTDKYWSEYKTAKTQIITNKAVARQSFPKEFKLYNLNLESLRQTLFASNVNGKQRGVTMITLPNADGRLESFEMFEASNFDAELQAQFPEIRAYSGKGITDKYATLKLSISPQGIQTMVFRTDKDNEFMETYSEDRTVYAVYKSHREKGKINWTCSVDDKSLFDNTNKQLSTEDVQRSSMGQLKTMRLAQSVTAEYSNYFGATSAAQVGLVLAAINNTLTRCNGVYEKDLGLHLNMIAASTSVIYYNAATDPYANGATGVGGAWNAQLQNTLSSTLGATLAISNSMYDIGHLFGASGGGGNAGCIGCVCVDDTASTTDKNKGSGFTSPGDAIPQGDNFDIDYVVHEVGHQLGANHTYSHVNEGSGVNKEVGSGVTIMGYAGITANDIAPHSIDIYHEASIAQIQANLATKTCPVTTSISANNATPVVNSVPNYVIPISTPFVLTGSATDANAGDALTYCWEQDDDGDTNTGASSSASITKVVGPNFRSWTPTASPSRYFPKLSSILANSATTAQAGGDAGMLSEALSSVGRELNFRLTVRDNAPFSAVAPVKVGQTAFTDMKVTVDAASGPFLLTAPNTAVSLSEGANQIVTWNVANTNTGAVNEKFVDIFFSTDGGNTYPILMASKVPNDGSENVTIPVSAASGKIGTQNRIMIKANNNVFFDISNVNMSTVVGGNTFAVAFNGVAGEQNKSVCQGSTAVYSIRYDALGGFSGTTTFSASGLPAGAVATFSPTTMSNADGTVTMTVTTLSSTPVGLANVIVTATSGPTTKTAPFYLNIENTVFGAAALTTPANNAITQNTSLNLSWGAASGATQYDVQVATDNAFTNIVATGTTTTTTYGVIGLSDATAYYWRVLPRNTSCNGLYGSPFKFSTGVVTCTTVATADTMPMLLSAAGKPQINSFITIPAGVSISDLNVTMNVDHAFVSDLRATLTGPTGTVVQLFTYPCGGNQNINATFDDSGVALACGANPAISGNVIPLQPLSAFNGTSSTGQWKLFIKDNVIGNGGQLNSWSLNICSIQPVVLSNPEFDLQGISLYPNPNKGDFTVKFTSSSRDDVKINVHDMRGRQVYAKSFSNTGTFDQNISLDNVQAGIYLVTIADGEKKMVKRIVVE